MLCLVRLGFVSLRHVTLCFVKSCLVESVGSCYVQSSRAEFCPVELCFVVSGQSCDGD